MIEAHDISVSLGRKRILSGVSMRAAAGAVTVVIGPNGSGKTTLLKTLAGELRFEGSVTINGRTLTAMTPREAANLRAVLPQQTALAFPYTVREIVGLGLINSAGPASGDDRVGQALSRVDLGGYAGRLYQELSGGEQQRVQLARVLCQVWEPVIDGEPRFLLLDEPVSSLDIRHQLAIMSVARDFAARGGGVLAVLHDLNLTAMFADEVVAMQDGRVAAGGSPEAVLTDDLLEKVFNLRLRMNVVPQSGRPFVLPQSAVAGKSQSP